MTDLVSGKIYQFDTTSTTQQYLASDTISNPLSFPGCLGFLPNGNLVVGDLVSGAVTEYDSSNNPTTLIPAHTAVGPNDSDDTRAAFMEPAAILVEPNGNMLIADLNYDGSNYHHQIVLYTASTEPSASSSI